MPRFFFHICDGNDFVEDCEGRELRNAAAARTTATHEARSIMADKLRTGILNLASFIEVEDSSHELVFILSFADVVTINPKAADAKTTSGSPRRKGMPPCMP